ncbi:MAG: hypothetical protein QOF79_17, partial [Actinomycetota bacterium]|nr:hypothetical protein [Actinomycetota bacterium]
IRNNTIGMTGRAASVLWVRGSGDLLRVAS